jgi:heme exporter protein A
MRYAAMLSAEAIVSVRGGRPVLDGVSLRLGPGEGVALTGPNGAGKSTLLRILAGLLPATAGRVVLTGVGENGAAGAIHYVGHQDAVKTQLTVRENLGFWARWQGAAAGRVDAAMDAFALTPLADLPAAVLSAGQRRRLGLARILLGERPLWLLDEPTVALDAASRERLRGVIAAHLDAGGILVAATHDDLAVASVAQRPLARRAASAAPAAVR